VAGMSYLQYLNVCSNTLRQAVKEPLRSKLVANGNISFREQVWSNATSAGKVEVRTYNPPPWKIIEKTAPSS